MRQKYQRDMALAHDPKCLGPSLCQSHRRGSRVATGLYDLGLRLVELVETNSIGANSVSNFVASSSFVEEELVCFFIQPLT